MQNLVRSDRDKTIYFEGSMFMKTAIKEIKKIVIQHPVLLKVISNIIELPGVKFLYKKFIRDQKSTTVKYHDKYLAELNGVSPHKVDDLSTSAKNIYTKLRER